MLQFDCLSFSFVFADMYFKGTDMVYGFLEQYLGETNSVVIRARDELLNNPQGDDPFAEYYHLVDC